MSGRPADERDSEKLEETQFTADLHQPQNPQSTQADETGTFRSTSALPDQKGITVSVPGYEIQRELGRGGMGVVYQARHIQLDRIVALKMILGGAHASQDLIDRFQNEAESVARLQHPHIVQIYEIGEQSDLPFISLEYCPGGSLESKLADAPMSAVEAARLVEQLARAMQVAHEAQVIHRDLKPANVLLSSEGEPKITDFGLAKKLDETGRTHTGAILGTTSYMSPEQASGKIHDVNRLTDIYALGAILYECLTGRPPFKAATPMETLSQVIFLEPVRPRHLQPSIPKDLETICLKCLQKKREQRYACAEDLAEDLRRFQNGEPIQARPTSRLEKAWRLCKRHPAISSLLLVFLLLGTGIALVWLEWKARMQSMAHVDRILTAETSEVPRLVRELEGHRERVEPLLRAALQSAELEHNARRELHTRLALLPTDHSQVKVLFKQLLESLRPNDVQVIRGSLAQYKTQLVGRCWQILETDQTPSDERFRAAAALALYDPRNPRWVKSTEFVSAQLVIQNPIDLGIWITLFRPARSWLISPLAEISRDVREQSLPERIVATSIISSYVGNQSELIVKLLLDASPKQFEILLPLVSARKEKVVETLLHKITASSNKKGPPDQRERQAAQIANAAIALLRMGQVEAIGPLLQHRADPTVRSFLIERMGPYGATPQQILRWFEAEKDPGRKTALLLALGSCRRSQLPSEKRARFISRLLDLYQTHSDSGLHSAIAWFLRKWDYPEMLQKADKELKTGIIEGKKWYVNKQRQNFVLIDGPVKVMIGTPPQQRSPEIKNELQYRVQIPRSFAIATTEVTLEQFQQFTKAQDGQEIQHVGMFGPTQDCPVNMVNWFQAAQYCRWLSEVEGVEREEMCYPPIEQIKPGMRLPDNYLSRTGYRLPTEAEWEWASRSGAVTSRFFGEAGSLLSSYAWYFVNSDGRSHSVGRRKPNRFGLFDVYGNVFEWCHSPFMAFANEPEGKQLVDKERNLLITGREQFVWKGGAFDRHPILLRSAYHTAFPPITLDYITGFRVARTIKSTR